MSGAEQHLRGGAILPGAFYWPDAQRAARRHAGPPSGGRRDNRLLWFVTYDIADPARLRRVAGCCENHGMRIQYSVFAVLASIGAIRQLRHELAGLIDARHDDIRFYRIAASRPIYHVGRSLIPADLIPPHPMLEQLCLALS